MFYACDQQVTGIFCSYYFHISIFFLIFALYYIEKINEDDYYQEWKRMQVLYA